MTNLFKFMSDMFEAMEAGEHAPQSDHDEPLWADVTALTTAFIALVALRITFQ